MKTNYYLGCGDFLCKNSPNERFNNETVPLLLSLGIKPEDMDKVAEIFKEYYELGFANGEDNTMGDIAAADSIYCEKHTTDDELPF